MGKKPKGFHTPFADLKIELPKTPEPARPTPASRAAQPATPPAERPSADEDLFATEMAGVARLPEDPRGRLNAPEPSAAPRPSRRAQDEAEAYAQLADLVEGSGRFDIADTDEYIEGLAPGIDRRLLKKLRKGDYALQAHLDLHGLTSDEARREVERFLGAALLTGKRCVLIIHGRGLNSKEGIPVLKERLKSWLTRGKIARHVLAFATARPADGGAGAVYVLLRR
jgi:DNA-nicking Smr family endonuclease